MTFALHPGAEQDIADALDFYATQAGIVVAQRFLAEFERVANLWVRHPEFGTPASNGQRVFPLQVFRYSVVYQPITSSSRVIVVRHQRRRPN